MANATSAGSARVAAALMAMRGRRSARSKGDQDAMQAAWSAFHDPDADVREFALSEVAGLWEAAIEGVLGGGGGSGVAMTWAVNEIELGGDAAGQTLYGTNEQELNDMERLGAGLARHLHLEDLTWENLGRGAGIPTDLTDLTNTITRDPRRVADLVALTFAEGRRLIFTCIAYGADRDVALDTGGTPAITYGADDGVMEAYTLRWASGHPLSDVSDTREYLDIRNTHELRYLAAMGRAIGQLLGDASALLTTCAIEDVVAGIEIFDLIDDRNVFYERNRYPEGDAPQSAKDWAHAFYVVASELSAELTTRGITVPIRLPGLSSYYETADRVDGRGTGPGRTSAEYRVQFLAAFLQALTAEAATGPVAAVEISSGINISWDRHSLKEKETEYGQLGMGHIAALVGDLARYRSILDAGGYAHTSLGVARTGVSVNDPDTVLPYFASRLIPTWWIGLSGTSIRQHLDSGRAWFQAYEVWRRLFGAAAGHAAVAGWETWMSKNRSGGVKEAYGMGLRDDRARDTRSANLAVPRPSWLAYQRLTTRVGSILSAEMLNPSPPTDVGYYPWRGLDYLVVMGARVTNAGFGINFAYLILIDPTLPSTRSGSYTVEVSARSGMMSPGCWQVPTVPKEAPAVPYWPLPNAMVVYEEDTWLTLPHWLSIKAGSAPILLLSASQLQFFGKEATAIDGDDPGDPYGGLVPIGPLEPPTIVWYTPNNADDDLDRINGR